MTASFIPKLLKLQPISEASANPIRGGRDHDPNHVLKEVFDDVRRLTRYAMETGALPKAVNVANLYRIRRKLDQNQELADEDLKNLAKYYQSLEGVLGPITAGTLEATEFQEKVASNGRVTRSQSRAGAYVRFLWLRTVVIVGIILMFNIVHQPNGTPEIDRLLPDSVISAYVLSLLRLIADYLIPFTYGALGASAFLLRETTEQLHARIFNPVQIPENRSRFVLGMLSGGAIVIFVSDIPDNVADPSGFFTVTGAALGFIAGYSTDLLFNTIERITEAILPRRADGKSRSKSTPLDDADRSATAS